MNAADTASNWDDDPLISWLVGLKRVVPPYCIEVVLTDGSRYMLHSMASHDEHTGAALMRIWDFRALSDEEMDGVRDKVLALTEDSSLAQPTALHPRLAWAMVRMRLADVAHCIESYATIWPERPERQPDRPRGIGFRQAKL